MVSGRSRISKLTLPSGIKIVHEYDPSSPAVAFHLWVSVGSANEAPREAGLSHFLEHMLFKGTENHDAISLNNTIENFGGNVNAYTSFEETAYHMVLSARFWEQGLHLLLDMVFKSLLDEDEMEIERGVILEELKEGEDSLDLLLSEKFFASLYPEHPFGRPVIGTIESIQNLTHVDLLKYYKKHYRPENVVISVAGNIDWPQTSNSIRNYFTDIDFDKSNRTEISKPIPPSEPPFFQIQKGKEERMMEIAFQGPGVLDGDIPVFDIITFLLGEGDMSRLHQALQVKKNLVGSLETSTFTTQHVGQMIMRFYPHEGKELETLREIALEIRRLCEASVGHDELERAKLLLEKEILFNDETTEGRARTLAYYEATFGNAEEEGKYVQKIYGITSERLRRVAKTYLDPAKCGVAVLLPTEAKPLSKSEVQEALNPKDGAKPKLKKQAESVPVVERFTLTNGTRVVFRRVPNAKVAGLFGASVGGLWSEDVKNNGISNLMASTMDRKTTTRDLEQIVAESTHLQADIGISAGRNTLALKMDVPNDRLIDALDLSMDVFTRPAFLKEDVDMERLATIRELAAQKDYFEVDVAYLFAENIFEKHPYGMNLMGRSEALKKIKTVTLKDYHQAVIYPKGTVIGVVADVPRGLLQEGLENALHDFKSRKNKINPSPKIIPIKTAKEIRKPIQGEKAYLWYGFPSVNVGHPDRYALDVLASALASSGGGRLFSRLREELGLVYSVDTTTFQGIDSGYFAIYLNTTADRIDETYEEIRNIIKQILDQGITSAELERVKNYVIGSHEIDLQRHGVQATMFCLGELFGTGKDMYDFTNRVAKVTLNQVHEVAKRILTLNKSVLVILSPNVH